MNRPESGNEQDNNINLQTFENDWIDLVPTLPLPRLSLDRRPEQVNLWTTVSRSSSNQYTEQNSWQIDKIPTIILPSINSIHIPISEALTAPQYAVATGVKSQFELLRNFIKSVGIYALASVAPPLVALILAPFLTHSISPADYGILTILTTLISLTAGITQLGLSSAFFRAYNYDYTSESDQNDVLATTTALLCIVSISTTITITIMSTFLADFFFSRSSLSNLFVIASGVVLLQNLSVPGFAWLRAKNRAFFYSLLSIGNLVIALIASLSLVGVLHLGIAGALIATGCGYAFVMFCTIPIIVFRSGLKIRSDISRSMLTFGLPLVLNFVAYWVLQLSDRYLLSLFGSLEQTAKYAVAYTLGSAISVLVIGPFTLAWPTTMFAVAKREDAVKVFQLIFRCFSMFLLFAAFSLSLVGTVLLDWLYPVTYHSVAFVIPIVATSITFYGVYFVFMIGANIKRKTWLTAVFTTIAALVNITLNLLLIPQYGAMGGAISTLIAYIVLASVAYIVNQRIYPISFEIDRFIVALLLGTALYSGSNVLAQFQGTYGVDSVFLSALVLYSVCLVILVKLPTRRRKVEV